MKKFNLGRIMPINKGEYSASTAYEFMDIVYHDGSSYWCIKNCQGVLPTDTTYWTKVVSRGVDGLNAYMPLKGWFETSTALTTAYPTPAVGDYAYVQGVSSVAIYVCNTAGTWSDSGQVFNPAYEQTFMSGESLDNVRIVDNLESNNSGDVLSAKQGNVLDQKVAQLGLKVSQIKVEIEKVDVEEAIEVTNDEGTETFVKISSSGVDCKNLKSNGSSVLTEHQDISHLAEKSYVDEELGNKQDKLTDISSEETSDSDDNITFSDNANNPVVVITPSGAKVKSITDLEGNPITGGSYSDTCYISPSGNDNNNGKDTSHPKKTINNALEEGFTTIVLLGGVYDQTINFTKSSSTNIKIKGVRGAQVIFKKADSLISNSGNETLVSGYTKVYKLENVAAIGYDTGTNRAEWLFFDEKEDARTAIEPSDAHPMERGLFYRCDCTKSIKTTADTLSSALDEIEALGENEYKWYYDNGALYFNRPDSTSVYALYKAGGNYFTVRENQSLELSNIEFRYGVVNLVNMNYVKVYNCASKCVYGSGAFLYNYSVSVAFVRCEAALCFFRTNGDGFNAAAESSTADYRSRRNQCLMIDCWSHDNNDDGYSDHEFGETTVIGGLFEYNHKAGITPSYGSHCTCHDVYSRHNWSGFAYVGVVNDRGNYGQVICYNCISEKNDVGGEKCGFRVTGAGNRMILYNCLAINEVNGFKSDTGCYLDLYDCKTLDCTNQKVGSGTTNVHNSSNVSL